MSLKLSKNNTPPTYDYLSEDGAMTNPAVVAVTIDKTGGTKTSSSLTLHLIASDEGGTSIGSYTGITVAPTTAQSGITWEISLDGSTWVSSISPSDMNCEGADAIIPVYTRIVANNAVDTPLGTGNYAGEFAINATENPPAV